MNVDDQVSNKIGRYRDELSEIENVQVGEEMKKEKRREGKGSRKKKEKKKGD